MAKVLIADDEPEIRKLLVGALTEAGHDTHEAFDGLGALLDVKEIEPDILVLDWMLPELSSNEVLNALREDVEYADFRGLKVLVVSDFNDEESRRTFKAAGANDFVSKTDDLDVLKTNVVNSVRQLLGEGA